MRIRRAGLTLLSLVIAAAGLSAAEHASLAKARALYNAADYDGAISAAAVARADPASADAAALVAARSHLERYRLRIGDPADLTAAREALGAVRAAALKPRDQIDLLVGLGQALFLSDTFGAAAQLFGTALSRASLLSERDRSLLLDWWATAMDREAQMLPADRRAVTLRPVIDRMEDELRQDPGSASANYWLAVSTWGTGDAERAWHAAVAAWVRAPLRPETSATLRDDIDHFVITVLVPERARSRPAKEQQVALIDLRAQWDLVKEHWK